MRHQDQVGPQTVRGAGTWSACGFNWSHPEVSLQQQRTYETTEEHPHSASKINNNTIVVQ
jgi:hypothetical protein